MLASALMFLLISDGSTSICTMFAFFANSFALPITLSLNLAPNTISKSDCVTPKFDAFVPCIPIIPVYLLFVPSKAPLPISESHTGASTNSANSLTSLSASEITAPPPTKINGFSDALIISATVLRSSSVILSEYLLISSGSLLVNSILLAVTSFVISTKTGPGLPLFAILKAFLSVGAKFSISFTIKLCFVIGIVAPTISISWNESFPKPDFATLAVIATSGTESIYAVAIPVTRFVAPGPDVAIQTPTFPVERAYPSAA